MQEHDYLNLRLVQLKPSEHWKKEAEGLSFVFLLSGAGHCFRGATKQPLSTGDVLLVNGDPTFGIQAAASGEFAFSRFSLRLEHLFPLFASTEISLLQMVVEGCKGYKFYPAASALAGECQRLVSGVPLEYNLEHRGHLLRLASCILTEEFKRAHTNQFGFKRPEDRHIHIFEQLSSDDVISLSIPELAKRFGCGRRHLNRLFHSYLGFSVVALRMEMRLIKAVSLLRNGDAKVINVAEECGFNHLGLFNTCFRKRFGTSPGQWRKKMADGTNGKEATENCALLATGLWRRYGALKNGPVDNTTQSKSADCPNGSAKPLHKEEDPAHFSVVLATEQKSKKTLTLQVRTYH